MIFASGFRRSMVLGFAVGIIAVIFNTRLSEASDAALPRIQTDQPMSLERLLDAARQHNPDLQKARYQLSINRMLKLGAIGEFLPSLSAGYQISQSNYYSPTFTNPDGTVSSYPITTTVTSAYWDSLGYYRQGETQTVTYPIPEGTRRSSSYFVQLQLSLNLGGREILDLSNADKTAKFNMLNLESSQRQVLGSVRQQYYWVLAYQRLLDLAKRVLDQSRDQLELAQVRYQVGSVTQLDVMQAEIDLGNRQNEVLSAENTLRTAREELSRLLGLDLSSEYPLVDHFEVSPPEFKLEDLISKALTDRQDFRMSELTAEINQNNVRKNRGNYLPTLTGSISHNRSEQSGGNVGFTLDPRNRTTTYSLGLSWSIFDGFSREVALQEARVSQRQSELDMVALRQSIEQSVRQAYYTLMRVWDQSKVTQKNRDLALRQLQLEQERYRLGSASQLELRSAQVTYTQAETDHINKTLEYLINLAMLEEAVGGSLQ